MSAMYTRNVLNLWQIAEHLQSFLGMSTGLKQLSNKAFFQGPVHTLKMIIIIIINNKKKEISAETAAWILAQSPHWDVSHLIQECVKYTIETG